MLLLLGKHKILDFMLSRCTLSISKVRLTEYSGAVRRQISPYTNLEMKIVDEQFRAWTYGKTKDLSTGDLSTIYIGLTDKVKLILSENDSFLEKYCSELSVPTIRFDEFVASNAEDERMIQLYNLIKVA